jgi:hypothetical protein
MSRIVELGLTSLVRTRRLIEVALRYRATRTVCYTGIDLFEAAPAAPEIVLPRQTLIDVFRTLRPTGAAVRLLPGEATGVLQDAANTLPGTDLLLIGHTTRDEDLANAWFYLPRMLHPGSLVLRERATSPVSFEHISLQHIGALAAARPRAAA